jgi:branched-chain amino acid transport system substrate-binding protein
MKKKMTAKILGAAAIAAASIVSLSFIPVRAAEPIMIGSVLDLTGPVGPLGEYAKRGIDIAVAEVNAAGGVKGRPLELVSLNSESRPDLASSLGVRLAGQSNVVTMIGGSFGAAQLALSAVAAKQKIPLVTPTGVVNQSQRSAKYTFFTLVSFDDAAKMMLDYAKRHNWTKLGLIRLEREYGELGSKFLNEFAPQYGVKIVAEERGADGDRDFTAQLTKIRAAKPDFMIVWFANPGGSLVLKNMRQLAIKLPVLAPISMDSAATVKLAGSAAEGLILTSQIAGSEVLPRQKKFADAYAKAYPSTPHPNTFEAIGYDLVKIVVAALEKSGEPYTREKIRAALNTLNYEGAGTIVRYTDEKHDPVADTIVLTKISKGKFVLAK